MTDKTTMTPGTEAVINMATALGDAATNAQHDLNTADFWAGYDPATAWRDGLVNGFGGCTGEYAGMLPPAVGVALADLLIAAARNAGEEGMDPRIMRVAEALMSSGATVPVVDNVTRLAGALARSPMSEIQRAFRLIGSKIDIEVKENE